MFALTTIFLLLFAGAFFALRIWQKVSNRSSYSHQLPEKPLKFASLFAPSVEELRLLESAEHKKLVAERRENFRRNLLLRANEQDLTVLLEARDFGDLPIYDELLDILAENSTIEKFTDFVSANNLPANVKVVEKCLANWCENISSGNLTKLLHISALTNSADNFLQTVEKIVTLWKEKRVKVTSIELVTAVESHFWLLANEARTSGAGFLLKERLADVRREVLGK